jgi:hypothetical protein
MLSRILAALCEQAAPLSFPQLVVVRQQHHLPLCNRRDPCLYVSRHTPGIRNKRSEKKTQPTCPSCGDMPPYQPTNRQIVYSFLISRKQTKWPLSNLAIEVQKAIKLWF